MLITIATDETDAEGRQLMAYADIPELEIGLFKQDAEKCRFVRRAVSAQVYQLAKAAFQERRRREKA